MLPLPNEPSFQWPECILPLDFFDRQKNWTTPKNMENMLKYINKKPITNLLNTNDTDTNLLNTNDTDTNLLNTNDTYTK